MNIKKAIESANDRGVGQFHVFGSDFFKPEEDVKYLSTWNSYFVAIAVAQTANKGCVYNSSGELVFVS